MKKKRLFQFLSLCLLFFLYSCGDNAFKAISDDSSMEACKYEVSKNLDKGNWDAVINSSCATAMDKGAAYFGRAGFDIKDVINRLIEAQDEGQDQDQKEDLDIYLKALVPKVTEDTLTDLNDAKAEYEQIPPDNPHYPDAQFYISLVDTVYSLSLMKVVIDHNGDGYITNCDINENNVPDDADAVACALMASGQNYVGQGNCDPIGSYEISSDITFLEKSGTYRGIVVNISGNTTSEECTNQYKRLLYRGSGDNYWLVTTTSEECTVNDDTWPCPIELNGEPLDFVTAIDTSLNSAFNALNQALPGVVNEDVTDAINEIRNNACGGDTCTSSEIANYIQNYLTTQ